MKAFSLDDYKLSQNQRQLFHKCREHFSKQKLSDIQVLMLICAKKTFEKCKKSGSKYIESIEKFKIRSLKWDDIAPFVENNLIWVNIGRTDNKKRAIMYALANRHEKGRFSHEIIMGACLVIMEAIVRNTPSAVTEGVIYVSDMQGLGWKNFDVELERLGANLMDSIPVRFKKMLMVNSPFILRLMLAMMRPFLSQKMASRLISCSQDELFNNISKSELDSHFGGTVKYDHQSYIHLVKETLSILQSEIE